MLATDPRVRLVYFFGSGVDDTAPTIRDVDLAILTQSSLSLDELTRLRADLVAGTHAPIDLVSLNEAGVVLAWEVVDHGVCLYARDPDIETEFVTRTRARYWDFKPYLEVQWRLAGERLAERRVGP
jgi:predicted nucleotidyltransferase